MQKSLRKPGVRPKTGELVDVDSQTEMDGYTRLAALIGNQPEYAIFRKYMTLRSLQLLHLNANIAHLEDELGEALKLDRACANPQNLYETSYRQLELSQKTSEPSKQLGVWQKLNIALKAQGKYSFYSSPMLNTECLRRRSTAVSFLAAPSCSQ